MKIIVGRVMKENTRSIHVLEKLGLRFDRTFDFDGKEGLIYMIEEIKCCDIQLDSEEVIY